MVKHQILQRSRGVKASTRPHYVFFPFKDNSELFSLNLNIYILEEAKTFRRNEISEMILFQLKRI